MKFSESLEDLRSFDYANIDVRNAGSWPLLLRIISLSLIFLLVMVLGYLLSVQNLYADYERLRFDEKDLKSRYEQQAFKVANLAAYKQQMDEMQEVFGSLLKQLPSDTEVPGLLEDITEIGLRNGLRFRSIDLGSELNKEFYVELPIQIDVEGTYHQIGAFVSGIVSMPRIVTLHDFNLDNSESDNKLSFSVTAKTYRYREANSGRKTNRSAKVVKKT